MRNAAGTAIRRGPRGVRAQATSGATSAKTVRGRAPSAPGWRCRRMRVCLAMPGTARPRAPERVTPRATARIGTGFHVPPMTERPCVTGRGMGRAGGNGPAFVTTTREHGRVPGSVPCSGPGVRAIRSRETRAGRPSRPPRPVPSRGRPGRDAAPAGRPPGVGRLPGVGRRRAAPPGRPRRPRGPGLPHARPRPAVDGGFEGRIALCTDPVCAAPMAASASAGETVRHGAGPWPDVVPPRGAGPPFAGAGHVDGRILRTPDSRQTAGLRQPLRRLADGGALFKPRRAC